MYLKLRRYASKCFVDVSLTINRHDGIVVYKLYIPNCYYNFITFFTLFFLLSTCFLFVINQLMDGWREGGTDRGTAGRRVGRSVGQTVDQSGGQFVDWLVDGRADEWG